MPRPRDEYLSIRTRPAGKRRLELEAVIGPGDEVPVSELVRDCMETLLLVADDRQVPLRQVVKDLKEQHRDEVLAS